MSDITQGQDGYAGQFGLADGTDEFNKTTFIVRQLMAELRTMIPVQVVAVASGGGGAVAVAGMLDVQPLVNQVDGLGNSQPHGNVLSIPYFRLQGGASAVILDPAVGDVGYMICADRDISNVVATGSMSNPGSKRRGSFSDGVYVGGILNQAPTQFIAFTSGGIVVTTSGTMTVNGNMSVSGNLTVSGTVSMGSLTVNGAITATGNITAGQGGLDQVTLQTHKHAGVTPGSASTQAPTPGT